MTSSTKRAINSAAHIYTVVPGRDITSLLHEGTEREPQTVEHREVTADDRTRLTLVHLTPPVDSVILALNVTAAQLSSFQLQFCFVYRRKNIGNFFKR